MLFEEMLNSNTRAMKPGIARFSRNIEAKISHFQCYNFVLDTDILCSLSASNLTRLLLTLKRISALDWSIDRKIEYVLKLEAQLKDETHRVPEHDELDLSQAGMGKDFRWHHHVMLPAEYFRLETQTRERQPRCTVCRGDPGLDSIPVDKNLTLSGHSTLMYKEALRSVLNAA